MTKKFLKNRSKRQSCRQKYKVAKKVREHLRKVRKEAKNNPKRNKKDPGVPNSLPFKAEVLLEAQNMKAADAEERRVASEQRKLAKQEAKSLQKLVANAEYRQQAHDKSVGSGKAAAAAAAAAASVAPELLERSAKAFHREFAKVVAESDVILEVLDARDPIGSRCTELEASILAQPRKRLVLVLNKADLVPRAVLQQWIQHLRQRLPCVAFRCSTQSQKSRIGHSTLPAEAVGSSASTGSRAAGVSQLMQLLANYCRNADIKTTLTVGIVGYPNTGKSSLINSLKRSKACMVGPTPGLTRCSQTVQLDKRIRLLDCPGIVLASGVSDTQLILRNCVRIETVSDPMPPVSAIIARCSTDQLMVFYNIAKFNNAQEFLSLLAKRMGRLRKGGLPDTVASGRKVLHDWATGRLTYYTMPPEDAPSSADEGQLSLVADWAKEFDLDSVQLLPDENQLDCKNPDALDAVVQPMPAVAMATPDDDGQQPAEIDEEEISMASESEEESEADASEMVIDPSEALKSKQGSEAAEAASDAKFAASMSKLQQNRTKRRDAKKQKKRAKRLDTRAAKLGGEFEQKMDKVLNSLGSGDQQQQQQKKKQGAAYDFDQHFPKA